MATGLGRGGGPFFVKYLCDLEDNTLKIMS